ncbi:MAG: glutathione synthase [Gammaproteobacteria bacterium]|nr:glutathione synthase [Gammaproteobacteria bacterium]
MVTKLGVVMDPIDSLNPKKDSTVAMMHAAQRKGWEIYHIEQNGLYIQEGEVYTNRQQVRVFDDLECWYEIVDSQHRPASDLSAILMRKDPPFDMEYVYSTYLLEMAEQSGTPVLNRPGSIRDCNEKLFALQFAQCCPPHVVSRDPVVLRKFHETHGEVIYKPLDGMGGASIFHVKPEDSNLSVIIETLTDLGQRQIMAQKYIPEIRDGDTRILLINGEPVQFGLSRVPASGESRGNLAAGGEGIGRKLNERDRWICGQVGPSLKKRGLYFVGIDVIGDYLTEINVTCPTCIRELDKAFDLDIAGSYMDFIEREIF